MAKNKYDNYSKEQLIAKLKQLEKKRYGLVWEDKPEDIADQCERELPVLVEDKSKEIISDPKKPTHFILEGDNYHTLYTLNFTHKKKIDVIYIDPPYNTGKEEEWRYNDRFVDKNDRYSHSKWLSFMNKRLRLAKNLLKDDGLILISIDDNELSQLKLLCNKIFNENNFVGQWHWFKSATPPNLSNKIKKNIEFVIGYEKKKNSNKYKGIKKNSKSDDPITKPQNSIKTLVFPPKSLNFKGKDQIIEPGIYGTEKYPNKLLTKLIIKNGTNKNKVSFENKFTWTQPKLDNELNNNTSINLSKALVISYKKENYSEEVPPNLIDESVGVSTTEEAGKRMFEMFGKKVFDYPKSVSLMKYLLRFRTFETENPIFLDFFAGSGTTGQAIIELNNEDGGNRQFILCTNNENNICEKVTYPRIEKVINGYNFKGKDKTLLFEKKLTFTNIYKKVKRKDKETEKEYKLRKETIINNNLIKIGKEVDAIITKNSIKFDDIEKEFKNNTIKIFGVNTISEFKKGIPANIKYFKTDFVPFALTDNDKRTLVSKSTELLCIAESTFEVIHQNKKKLDYAIFKNETKQTAIIYDEDCIEKCCIELNKIKPKHKTIIYVFSYDHTYEEDDFENLNIDFVVKPIPEAIINVYRKISKLKNK